MSRGKLTVTITGEAKSGKSTLAMVILAALPPVCNNATLNGEDESMAALIQKRDHARKILRNKKITIRTQTLTRAPSEILRGTMHIADCGARDGKFSCDCGKDQS